MARKVFFSFHFDNDYWRTQQVRNIGSIEGNTIATPNKWEEVKRNGDSAIQKWINDNLKGKSCLIVLVGSKTAGRKWIDYEIEQAWAKGMGVLGIRIHNLKDRDGKKSVSGTNPFSKYSLCDGKKAFSKYAILHSPSSINSKTVYKEISENLEKWIEDAIQLRNDFKC